MNVIDTTATSLATATPVSFCASSIRNVDPAEGPYCDEESVAGRAPSNVGDGDQNTRWQSGQESLGGSAFHATPPHWVSLDLGSEQPVASVFVQSRNGYQGDWSSYGGNVEVVLTTGSSTDPDSGVVARCAVASTAVEGQQHTVACVGTARYVFLYTATWDSSSTFSVAQLVATVGVPIYPVDGCVQDVAGATVAYRTTHGAATPMADCSASGTRAPRTRPPARPRR